MPTPFLIFFTGPQWFDRLEALLPAHRERMFPPTETLSIFLGQALSADRSCQNAVNEAAVKRLSTGLAVCSTHTGAYCRARQRLPLEMVHSLVQFTGREMSAGARSAWHWRGQPVRLVDGTTLPMPDTPANQATYPQSRSQKPGLGSPLCRLLGLVCLGSGVVLNAALGPYRGKGGDEQCLLRSVSETQERGDLLLGDAHYATTGEFSSPPGAYIKEGSVVSTNRGSASRFVSPNRKTPRSRDVAVSAKRRHRCLSRTCPRLSTQPKLVT